MSLKQYIKSIATGFNYDKHRGIGVRPHKEQITFLVNIF